MVTNPQLMNLTTPSPALEGLSPPMHQPRRDKESDRPSASLLLVRMDLREYRRPSRCWLPSARPPQLGFRAFSLPTVGRLTHSLGPENVSTGLAPST
ncbi:uncharacterized protein Dvir_GJ27150 [Drosophila virilis]|uniref:Uncharacterized protein n=1 Tax=Drosophila virilis TaxID=7244 RepID=A0A0Q9W8E0_DROVI|nr:uncharacterized protein LOC26531920 isoform X3 [Drosophila virilis]KRF80898.1 uncharacterized protein Dvir_GJ27150 [Drosophila virilis]